MIKKVIEIIKISTGFVVGLEAKKPLISEGYRPEFLLNLKAGKKEWPIIVEIVPNASNPKDVKSVVTKMAKLNLISVLVTSKMNSKLSQYLDSKGVGFVSLDGQVSIPLKFGIKHKKKEVKKKEQRLGRAPFKGRSLTLLVYEILSNPSILNCHQREMARQANISLGSVNSVLKRLIENDYLIDGENLVLKNKKELIQTWSRIYVEGYREYSLIGRYKLIEKDTPLLALKKRLSNVVFVQWGGDVAGQHYTSYLSPGEYTIYSFTDRVDSLVKELRMIPDPKGEIKVYRAFWKHKIAGHVPPLIAYADLLGNNDDRSKEVAEIILSEELINA